MANNPNAAGAAAAAAPAAETKKDKEPEAPKLVSVRATCALVEGGERYEAGSEFQTTPERAKALGPHVEAVG